jgi:L-lactate dehydrogenase complex protein LldF
MDIFRHRIRQSLADANLQAALDANAQRRRDGRLAAFASVPDYQERRLRAHAIKADVVAHLDEYLAQFITKVEANGIIIHRAKDADEAIRIFLQIANNLPQRTQSTQRGKEETFVPLRDLRGEEILVAKSKSMVSEEINLNHALETAGIRVVETDLGEYIVQLRGERPSHIITPAVHLRRGDVGKLFEEKLGLPYTEEIPVLTNTARKVLREVFLTADIGVSGVNFGVAETGTLCLVTNEGNGRMVTTLPPVHVALMGMERLVPTLDDLALFLSLLPRSATGQKLSVYTSLINAPLPNQTRHLIVLDNGRSALRASPLAESLYCIRCGACLNACPVFREIGGHAYGSIYPGPIGSVISSALVDAKFAYLSQASSLCGACREACPVDIDLPGMLLKIRAGENGKRDFPGVGLPAVVKLGLRLFRRAAASPRLFTFAQRTIGLFPLPAGAPAKISRVRPRNHSAHAGRI